MSKDDVTEIEVRSSDLLKRFFNQAERESKGPPKRILLSVEARKLKRQQEREARAKKEKELRASRLAQGICTRCGEESAVEGCRMCEKCQVKHRKYPTRSRR